MYNGKNGTRLNLNIPEEIANKVQAEADRLFLSKSAFCTMVFSQYFHSLELVNNMPQVLATMRDVVEESKRVNPDYVDTKIVNNA